MKDYILFFNCSKPDILKAYLKKHKVKYSSWFESILNKSLTTCGGMRVEAIHIMDNEVYTWASRGWYTQTFQNRVPFVDIDTRNFIGEI